jgi:hypothetical protein
MFLIDVKQMIIGHRSHMKGRLGTGGIQKRKETIILNVVDVLSV